MVRNSRMRSLSSCKKSKPIGQRLPERARGPESRRPVWTLQSEGGVNSLGVVPCEMPLGLDIARENILSGAVVVMRTKGQSNETHESRREKSPDVDQLELDMRVELLRDMYDHEALETSKVNKKLRCYASLVDHATPTAS